jgi:hemerythrin-like domain-containing protein
MEIMEAIEAKKFVIDGYLYIHKAMRSDLAKLEATSKRFASLSNEDAGKIQKWFRFFWDMVEVHHVEEDKNFFPDITRRVPTFARDMDILTKDHVDLHHKVDEIGNLLNKFQTIKNPTERTAANLKLGELISQFRASLNDHLDREEAVTVPTIAENFSLKEQKAMGDKAMRSMPTKHLALVIPWVGSGLPPEEVGPAMKTLPLPLRIMYKISWKKKYEKFTEVFK